jgi:uncharacterized beta-barrel protein YwiB (DUF1934 family)
MQACKFIITTTVDEKENTVVHNGNLSVEDTMTKLTYAEERAHVCITLQKGIALIERQGDYTLRLRLEEGKTHVGVLGIGGAEGNVSIKTHRVKYSLENGVFKLSLGYDLIFSGKEIQKTKLNLKAHIRG